jgi:hypothetical protein
MEGKRPRVNNLILQVVENQLQDKTPPEAAQVFEKLVGEGYSEEDSKHLIGSAIVAEMRTVVQTGKPFNAERYVGLLAKLPELPTESV